MRDGAALLVSYHQQLLIHSFSYLGGTPLLLCTHFFARTWVSPLLSETRDLISFPRSLPNDPVAPMSDSRPVKRKLSEAYPESFGYFENTLLYGVPASVTLNPQITIPEVLDVDLVSAADALTRLNKESTSTPHFLSRSPSVAFSTDTALQVHPIVLLMNAMSRLPIVTNAVRYYETSKRNYATFNYAAEFVEKAAIPVFSKIEVNLNNMHQARQEKAEKKRRLDRSKKESKTETKTRLKFCLHILKLANDNISAKVSELQLRISDSRQDNDRSGTPEAETATKLIKQEEQAKMMKPEEKFDENELTRVPSTVPEEEANTEIIKTVKKIIHIISNFRPSSLSASEESSGAVVDLGDDETQLRSTIRSIILNLPNKVQKSKTASASFPDRVIEFARESLEMISLLTNVFNEQLKKAESWVDGPELYLQQDTPNSSTEILSDSGTDKTS